MNPNSGERVSAEAKGGGLQGIHYIEEIIMRMGAQKLCSVHKRTSLLALRPNEKLIISQGPRISCLQTEFNASIVATPPIWGCD